MIVLKATVQKQCSKQSLLKVSSEAFFKIDFLKNFPTRKHLRWIESFSNKDADLKVGNFIKKRLQHRSFPVNIAKSLRAGFFIEHLQWLFLLV